MDSASDAVSEWLEAISKGVCEDLRQMSREKAWFRNPIIRIGLNDQAILISGGDDRCTPDLFFGDHTENLVRSLRKEGRDILWPLTLRMEMEGLDNRHGWRVTPRLSSIEAFGLNFEPGRGVIPKNRYGEAVGVVEIFEAAHILERMTPPSNGPVRSWSRVSDMMGSVHVHHQGVYARSEAEALLKIILHQEGLEKLREMERNGRVEVRDGPFRTWFTSTEILDLDLLPEGRVTMKEDAADLLNAFLSRPDIKSPEL